MIIDKKDIAWNYAGIFFRLGVNVIIMPLILAYLTEEEIGLWYIFASVGNIVILFDFGFAATLARNIAYCWSGAEKLVADGVVFLEYDSLPNIKLLKTVLFTCRIIYLLISSIALLILLFFGTPYISKITNVHYNDGYIWSWICYCIGVFFNLYYGYFTSFLKGIGAIAENNKAIVISKLIQVFISYILLKMGGGLFAISLAFLISGLGLQIISKKLFFGYEQIGEKLKKVSSKISIDEVREIFRTVWYNAWRDGLVSLSNYMMTQVTTLICSLKLSLQATGQYGLCLQIITLLANVAMSLYGTYQPMLQQYHLQNNKEGSRKILSLSVAAYWIVFVSGILACIIIGIPFIQIIKPGYVLDKKIFLAMAIYALLYNNHSLFSSYISNTNSVPYTKAYCVSAFFTVLISSLLLYLTDLGIWGVILAEVFVNLLYNNWKWPKLVLDELHISFNSLLILGISNLKALLIATIKKRK